VQWGGSSQPVAPTRAPGCGAPARLCLRGRGLRGTGLSRRHGPRQAGPHDGRRVKTAAKPTKTGTRLHVAPPEPRKFADRWIEAWNARDIEAVLTHYSDDVVFTSPTALQVVPESGGTVRGKLALRSYWTLALERNRDLHFELIDVYAGIDTLVLHYRNQVGGLINEVLTFRDGLVASGHATHLQPAGSGGAHLEPDPG
jgi:ketosteroid isomerase-like protein